MAHPIYADFTAGEISERAAGRVDLALYHKACRKLENFLVLVQGGAERRPGTIYVAEAYSSAAKSRLVPWEEPEKQYMLELCNSRLRIYQTVEPYALVHEITTSVPWTTAQLGEICWAFDGAFTMFFTHRSWKPVRLVHTDPTSDTAWTLDVPSYTIANYTDTSLFKATGKFPALCGFYKTRLVFANATLYPNRIWFSCAMDQTTGEPRYTDFTINPQLTSGTADSTTTATVTDAARTEADDEHWVGSNIVFTAGPAAGEVRKITDFVASTDTLTVSPAFSASPGANAYLIMRAQMDEGLGLCIIPAVSRGGQIRWLAGQDVLFAGTSAGEAIIGAGERGLTPADPGNVRSDTFYGGAGPAVRVGDAVLFLQKGKQHVREMALTDSLRYVANDLMTLADHMGQSGILELDYSSVPYSLLYAVRADGQLPVLTYERALQILAWSRLVTQGSFESVGALTTSLQEDQVWCLVNRTINGATKRYLERFSSREWAQLRDACLVDCAKIFDNGAAKPISAISMTNPIVVSSTAHGLADGTKVRLKGIVGSTELNNRVFTVDAPAADSFSLRSETDSEPIDGTAVKVVLDAAPTPAVFAPGATLTGALSGKTATVVSRISDTEYYCTGLARPGFTAGETIGDGVNSRACAAPCPLSQFYYTAYSSGGEAWKVQKQLTGLTHLALKTVKILGDGAVIPPGTVDASGNLTLDEYCNKIIVGLPFTSKLLLMPLEAGAYEGTAQGRRKRIDRLTARFYRSVGCQTGPDEDHLEPLRFPSSPAPAEHTEPYTGDLEVPFPGDFETEGNLMLVQDEPLPLTVVGIFPRLQTNE